VIVLSNHKGKLEIVPKDFKTIDLSRIPWMRKSPKLIDHISKVLKIDLEDMLVLGAKADDMILAANAKVVLLTADYAKVNNPDNRIYSGGYGVGILSIERLKYFFDHYLNIDSPWFCSYHVNDNYSLYGLTSA